MLQTHWSFSDELSEMVRAGFGRGKRVGRKVKERYPELEAAVIAEVRESVDDVIGDVLDQPIDIWLRQCGVTLQYLGALKWDFDGDQLVRETAVDESWWMEFDFEETDETRMFPFEFSVDAARKYLKIGLIHDLRAKLTHIAVGELNARWLREYERADGIKAVIGNLTEACGPAIFADIDAGCWDKALRQTWVELKGFLNPDVIERMKALLPRTGCNRPMEVYQYLECEDGEFDEFAEIPVLWELILRSDMLRVGEFWKSAETLRLSLNVDIGKKHFARLARMSFDTISSYDHVPYSIDELVDALRASLSHGGKALMSRDAFMQLWDIWSADMEGVVCQVFKRAREMDLATFGTEEHPKTVAEIERVVFWLLQNQDNLPDSIGRAKWSRLLEHVNAFELKMLSEYKTVQFEFASGCETSVAGCRVTPLDSPFGMLYAGCAFRNCLGSHAEKAAAGHDRYFILDDGVERAAVQLTFDKDDGKWIVCELHAKCNEDPSKEMTGYAEELAVFYSSVQGGGHAVVEFEFASLNSLRRMARDLIVDKFEGFDGE